jgi:hypothetical protein
MRSQPSKRDLAIIAAYKSGSTLWKVGGRFGISGERVRQILALHGIASRSAGNSGGRHSKTQKLIPHILDLYDRGLSAARVASRLACSRDTVLSVLHENHRKIHGRVSRRCRVVDGEKQFRCPRCKRWKPIKQDGYRRKSGRECGKPQSMCRACLKAYYHAYYLSHRKAINDYNKRWYREKKRKAAAEQSPRASDE